MRYPEGAGKAQPQSERFQAVGPAGRGEYLSKEQGTKLEASLHSSVRKLLARLKDEKHPD